MGENCDFGIGDNSCEDGLECTFEVWREDSETCKIPDPGPVNVTGIGL